MPNLYKVQQRNFFRTPVRIKIPVDYPDDLFDELFGEFDRVDRTFNSHTAGSVTDRINRQAGEFLEIDEETEVLFSRLLEWSEFTEGRFDITITPLLRLWGFFSLTGTTPPSRSALREVTRRVNFRQIEMVRGRIRIGAGQEITTGGFLKGYAVDCVLAKIRRYGITDAIVNAGGSSIGCLTDEGHPVWSVTVTDPVDGSERGVIFLHGGGLSTSSALSRQVVYEGNTCSHILDSATGLPVYHLQCGVLTADCFTGDILSTTLLQSSPGEFLPCLERYSKQGTAEGYLITADGRLIDSNCLIQKVTYHTL